MEDASGLEKSERGQLYPENDHERARELLRGEPDDRAERSSSAEPESEPSDVDRLENHVGSSPSDDITLTAPARDSSHPDP